MRPLLEFLGDKHICSAGAAEPVEWSPGAAGGHGCLSWREGSAKNEAKAKENNRTRLMKILHLVLCPWILSSVSWFIVYGNLDRICTLLLCENCINLKLCCIGSWCFSGIHYHSTFLCIHSINF